MSQTESLPMIESIIKIQEYCNAASNLVVKMIMLKFDQEEFVDNIEKAIKTDMIDLQGKIIRCKDMLNLQEDNNKILKEIKSINVVLEKIDKFIIIKIRVIQEMNNKLYKNFI